VAAVLDEVHIPIEALKGRGAATQLAHRFERDTRQAFDDGWDTLAQQALVPQQLPTEVIWEDARSIIGSNDSPDVFFEQSINPYRGCEHGCIYCYARPTHSYLNLSPGLDFETKIIAKRNIAALLRAELSRKSYQPKLIAIGSATDCYQPVERELRLTRAVIELMQRALASPEMKRSAQLTLQTDTNVLQCRQMRKHSGNLEGTDDAATRDLRRTLARDVDAVKDDLTRSGHEKFGEQIEAGGLACAVGPDERMNRTALHAQVHAIDCGKTLELTCEPARLEYRIAENHVPFHAK